jgi:hypothetical protein
MGRNDLVGAGDVGLEALHEAAQGVGGDDDLLKVVLGDQAGEVGLGDGMPYRSRHLGRRYQGAVDLGARTTIPAWTIISDLTPASVAVGCAASTLS